MRVVSKGFSMKGTILVKRHTKGFVRQRRAFVHDVKELWNFKT